MYTQFTRAIIARPRMLVLAWLGCALVCGLIIAFVPGNIASTGILVPGSGSTRAEEVSNRNIPIFASPLIAVVITSTNPSPATRLASIEATIGSVAKLHDVRTVEGAKVGSYEERPGSSQTSTIAVYLVQIALPYIKAEQRIPLIEDALKRAAPKHVSFVLFGEAAEAYHYSTIIRSDLIRAELIALPAMFFMLVLAFLSGAAAFLPIFLATVVLTCALAVVHIAGLIFGLSVFVVNAASAVSLGLSVNYSLIIVTRFREERQAVNGLQSAVARVMQTAGRAIILSGLTVALLLTALMVVGINLFTSIALGGMIASLTTVLAATTLLPAILVVFGDRLDRYSIKPAVEAFRRGTFWVRLSKLVTTHAKVSVIGAVAVLLVLAIPALSLKLNFSNATLLPPHSPVARAEHNIEAAFGPGADGLVEVVTREPESVTPIIRSDPNERAIWRTYQGIDDWSDIVVALKSGPNSEAARETVTRLRHRFGASHSVIAFVGGVTASEMDLGTRVLGRLPVVVLVAIGIALLALAVGMKSIVIPIKAMVCSALSVMATLGLLQVCFPSSAPRAGITFFVPILTFALVLGLSIDYEVFLLTRVREGVDIGHTTASAVSYGITRTARPITLAGLVVVSVFVAFIFSSLRAVQELGVAVTIGVLLDISLVRWILSPACVVLAGRWNWWWPRLPRKRVRV